MLINRLNGVLYLMSVARFIGCLCICLCALGAGGCKDHFVTEDDRLYVDSSVVDPVDGATQDTVQVLLDTQIDLTSNTQDAVQDDVEQEVDIDVEPVDLDRDLDGVPNEGDYWPDDPEWPGMVNPDYIYFHSFDSMFYFDSRDDFPNVLSFMNLVEVNDSGEEIGWFGVSAYDMAVDRYGVLYILGDSAKLYACQPERGRCRRVEVSVAGCGGGYGSPNAMGWVEAGRGVLGGVLEGGVLMAVGGTGWCGWRGEVEGGDLVGFRGERVEGLDYVGWWASGDVVQTEEGIIWGTAYDDVGRESLLWMDVGEGGEWRFGWREAGEVGVGGGIWGLAARGGRMWGFDSVGQILEIYGARLGERPRGEVLMGMVTEFGGGASMPTYRP